MVKRKNRVAVIDALRTPFVRSFGVFEQETALTLSQRVTTEIISRTGIQATDIDECIWGCVVPQTKNANLAREIILFSGLPTSIPGFTLNKACDSSLQSIEVGMDRILLGKNQLVLAGGVEVLSDVPLPFSDEARRFFTKISKSKTLSEKFSLIMSIKPKWFLPIPPSITEPFTGMTMGEHAEVMAVKNDISRKRQDELAYKSHVNANKAWQEGVFQQEVIPVWSGKDKSIFVDKDNMVRADTSLEALAKLNPVFDKRHGTITAGNSSPLTDGAAVTLLASENYIKDKGISPLGYLIDSVTVAVDPKDQLLIGPAHVIPRLLERNGLSAEDVGVFEIHEAFAAQVLSCLDFMKEHKIPLEKLNVHGGSIAIGHPFGATGARMVGAALRAAKRTKSKYAIVAICAAGGIGMGMLLEQEA